MKFARRGKKKEWGQPSQLENGERIRGSGGIHKWGGRCDPNSRNQKNLQGVGKTGRGCAEIETLANRVRKKGN